MAAPFSNFRTKSPRTRGLHRTSPRCATPRIGMMGMPGSSPRQQKPGGFTGFCAVCNIKLNSEFQSREHYGGRTHQNNMSMLNLLPSDQPNPGTSGYSGLCTVCNIKLNSEFQAREHYGGKTHLNNVNTLGLASNQAKPSTSVYLGFCTVCNIKLNSEFQAREHFGGKTHLNNVDMLGVTTVTPDQPKPSTSGYSGFCTVCNIKLNSEFQAREHFGGKNHLNNMEMLGLKPDQLNSNNSGFSLPAEPVKRSATNSIFPFNATKKPKLSQSASEVQGKNHLALLLEYKPGLEFVMKSEPGKNNATLFTATVEIDGKTYDASAPNESMAKSSVASIVFAYIGSQIEEVLAQRAAEKEVKQLVSDVKQESKKEPEDFTSLDDICDSASFSCFSQGITSFAAAGVGDSAESDDKAATAGSADDLSVKVASAAKSDISGGNGTVESGSGSAADNGAVPGNSGAKVPVASATITDFKKCRSSTAILNLIRLGIKRDMTKEPSANDPLIEEFVVTNVVDGETFKGRALTKECAKAYAAEEALVKLFGMTFEKDKRGIPIFTGDASEILKARNTMQPSVLTERVTTLELVDGKSPVALLNEIFQGQVTYTFHPQVLSQWGLEHRCSVTVGGMTVEGQDVTKKASKNRAALAAVAALKASGMFPRLLAESKSRHIGLPIQLEPVAEPQPVMMLNATARLLRLFPGTKYEPQGEVVGSDGKKMVMIAVKVEEKVFTGTGTQPKYARANAAENAMRSLGLWTDEAEKEKKQLMSLSKARNAQKNARYGFSPQPAIVWTSQTRAPAMGQALRGRGRGRILRGAGLITRGLGRGIVAQRGQREGTMTRGQRRARGNTARGRRMRGRGIGSIGGSLAPGSGNVLALGGSYYNASGSTLSTGLGLDEPSTLYSTSGQLNFIGSKPRGSPRGNSSVNTNLLQMAHGSSYDNITDAVYDFTSNAACDTTYDSSSYDPPTDPYAHTTPGCYDNPTDPSVYSTPLPRGSTRGSRRLLRSRGGRSASHLVPSVMHQDFTSMSYTQISNDDGSGYEVTKQIISGTRASPRSRRMVRSRGSIGPSPLSVTYSTDFPEECNYDNAYSGYEGLTEVQNYGSYSDSSAAVELSDQNDGLQYDNGMEYLASPW